jgi:hypothetical protein
VSHAHARRLNLLALVVLVVALAAGIGLRLYAQHSSPNVQHDEAWSYASASGRLGPFLAAMDEAGANGQSATGQGASLTGRWVPAGEWQRFWTSEGLSDVEHIATDLSTFDVHPPLYFGLLHGWLLVAGESVGAGRALNLLFAAFTVLGIYGLARALGFISLEAALAALVWAVSPAVVGISAIARQYDLLALVTVLLVWGLVRATTPRAGGSGRERGPAWPGSVWLAAATAAALLTHYQAILLVAGAAVWAVAGVPRRGSDGVRRPWWQPLLGLAAGTVVAGLLAPGWRLAFTRERDKLDGFSTPTLLDKLDAIGATFARFLGVPGLVLAVAAVVVLAILLVLLAVPRTRATFVARVRGARPGWWTLLFFLAVTAGGVCLQNLLFLSMPPRISARYLAMAWPFVAFVPLLVFGLWPRARYALTAALCLLVLLPTTLAAPLLYGGADRLPLQRLADADAVLVDNVGVGELPRFLWFVPGDAEVFAGTQEQFLADKPVWAEASLGEKAYYVSILRKGGVGWRRKRILHNLRKTHDVELVATNGMAEIYAITPKGSSAQ